MIFGKLADGQIIPAPNPLKVGGSPIYNPTADQYVAHGWLPIIDTPMPGTPAGEEPKYYTFRREVRDSQIIRVWEETTPPESEPASIPSELLPAKRREQAYNAVPCIKWGGNMLTITDASQQWVYYAAEGDTAKTDELTALISEAKAAIRAQYPDGEEESDV